jgi:hypothetical protein
MVNLTLFQFESFFSEQSGKELRKDLLDLVNVECLLINHVTRENLIIIMEVK